MANEHTETVTVVTGNEEIRLTITIGNGQVGSSIVGFDNSMTVIGNGDITRLLIGKGDAVKGKTLKIISVVTDFNHQSNDMVITYRFDGCTAPAKPLQVHAAANNDGDTVTFTTLVHLS